MATWTSLARRAFVETCKAWGGVTIDLRMREEFNPTHGYAVKATKEPTLTIPEDIDGEGFVSIFIAFVMKHLDTANYIGVFHDSDKGTIEFDVVAYVVTKQEVDQIAKFSGAESAYEFHTGNGYFPNGK